MRKVFTLVCFFLLVCAGAVDAQCTTCTPMFINTCPPAGGLCNRLDTAYAHLPYLKVMNFYMPAVLNAPSILSQCDGCSQVDLNSLTVTGVSGLPAGINYVISNGGQFNVQGGDTIGCASFCGTPLAPGLYPVTVYLSADVEAIGTPIGNVSENNVPQQYYDTLLVLPDTIPGVTSFTYGNNGFEGCDSITVNLSALLSAPQPNLTRYFWQIGSNQSSQLQSPGSFTFTNHSNVPDTIPITLSTVFYNYTVQDVHVAQITGGFCGDIPHQQLTCLCLTSVDEPNPFVEFPYLGFDNNSNAAMSTCTNINFDNLGVIIPLGTDTLNMQLWDADEGDPFHIYTNELISTYTLNVLLGQYNFADDNAEGYVQFDTIAGTTVTETLYVIVNPNPPLPVIAPATDTFCAGGSVLVSIDSAASYTNCSFQWYVDTVFLDTITDSAFYATQGGNYKVIVTNQLTGCMATSPLKAVTAAAMPESPETVEESGANEYLNPAPSAGFAVNWYYNGNLVAGQNGHTLPYYGGGVYTAQVYNVSDPACFVNTLNDTVTAIGQVNKPVYNVNIAPNPNNGTFNLSFHSPNAQNINIALQNTLGQTVYAMPLTHFTGDFNSTVEVADLSKGIYVLTIESVQGVYSCKVVVQ